MSFRKMKIKTLCCTKPMMLQAVQSCAEKVTILVRSKTASATVRDLCWTRSSCRKSPTVSSIHTTLQCCLKAWQMRVQQRVQSLSTMTIQQPQKKCPQLLDATNFWLETPLTCWWCSVCSSASACLSSRCGFSEKTRIAATFTCQGPISRQL